MSKTKTLLFLLIVVALIVSLPILQSGFFSDDIVDSSSVGVAKILHLTMWQYTWQRTWASCLIQGRILFCYLFTLPLFYYCHTALTYQIVRVIVIWLSVISGAWLVQLITKNTKLGLFFVLLFPVFWTISYISNALVSYGLQLQLPALGTMLMLCCFIQWFEKKKLYWLGLSLFAYVLAISGYELGLIAFPSILILAWLRKQTKKQFCLQILPFVVVSFIYFIAYFFVRHYADIVYGGGYSGVALARFNFHQIMTFIFQLTAALPLTYGILHGHYFKVVLLAPFFKDPVYLGLLIILFCAAGLAFYQLCKSLQLNKKQSHTLIALGLPLWSIPALLIGLSEKYQTWLTWGMGYTSLYVQYFGMTLLLLCLLNKIKKYPIILSCLFSLILCVSLLFNLIMVQYMNDQFKYSRDLEVQAIHAGILSSLPPNSWIMTKDRWAEKLYNLQGAGAPVSAVELKSFGDLSEFYMQEAGLPLRVAQLFPWQPDFKAPAEPLYFLRENHIHGTDEGTVILGKVEKLDYTQVKGQSMLSRIMLIDVVEFSSLGQKHKLIQLAGPQNIGVSWVFVPFFGGPTFSPDIN